MGRKGVEGGLGQVNLERKALWRGRVMEPGPVGSRGNEASSTSKGLALNRENSSYGAGERSWVDCGGRARLRACFTLPALPRSRTTQPLLCAAPTGCWPVVLKFHEGV